MNCVNHPEVPVSAYCQNCGKALCSNCVRSVGGVVYCEQCLAARLGMGGPVGVPPVGAPDPGGPNPAAAFLLGFIPGVGAMYNGQFIKGLIHVVIFIILIGITEHVPIFGIFIAAWIAYQVFDALETAKARREGRPLPDPFGFNEISAKMVNPAAGPGAGPGAGHGAAQGFAGPQAPPPPPQGMPPAAGFADPYYSGNAPYPGFAPPPPPGHWCGWRRREPIGAIILIVLGALFLLNTMNIFDFDWFGHLWPLLIIGFGVALFLRRSREVPPPPPPPPPPGGVL